jgi:protein-S-isoprenylcysteine O-methyltransferase Ste14
MTAAHLVFAIATTAYIFTAIQLEEQDLMRIHKEYAQYRRDVPMILPAPAPRKMERPRLQQAG